MLLRNAVIIHIATFKCVFLLLLFDQGQFNSAGTCFRLRWPSYSLTNILCRPSQLASIFDIANTNCNFSAQPCAAIFRSLQSVERCIIRLIEDDPKLVFEMECKFGARRVYKFNVEEATLNCAIFDKINAGMHVTIKPKSLIDAMNNFSPNQEEIRWILQPTNVQLSSHFNEVRLPASEIKNRAPVSLALDANDFERYELGIGRRVEFVSSLHDMRPALTFAEKAGTPVAYTTVYDVKKPVVMSVGMANLFVGDFVFATCGDLKVDDGTGSEASLSVPNGVSPSQPHSNSSRPPPTSLQPATSLSQSSSHRQAPASYRHGSPSAPNSGAASGSSSGWAPPADDSRIPAAMPPRTIHGTPHHTKQFGQFNLPANPTQPPPVAAADDYMLPASKRRKLADDLDEGDVADSQSE